MAISKITLLCLMSALSLSLAAEPCAIHAEESCQMPGDEWTSGPCNAVFGGFSGNANNLHQLMAAHFQDSFKLLFIGSHFNSDEVNRLGIHKLMSEQSDAMWERGKSLMKYILQRGGKMGKHFKIPDLDVTKVDGEVESLATALDILKNQAENCILTYKHASNKVHSDLPEKNSFDPALSHFLEEKFIDPYTSEIRDMAGRLNLLAKIARNDKTRAMGLHLFDSHLR